MNEIEIRKLVDPLKSKIQEHEDRVYRLEEYSTGRIQFLELVVDRLKTAIRASLKAKEDGLSQKAQDILIAALQRGDEENDDE